MLNERRRAADLITADFLKAEHAADQAAILASSCMATMLHQRAAARLPTTTGLAALQLISEATADLVRARHRLVDAHRELLNAKADIGLRAYGDESECPPSGIQAAPVILSAVA